MKPASICGVRTSSICRDKISLDLLCGGRYGPPFLGKIGLPLYVGQICHPVANSEKNQDKEGDTYSGSASDIQSMVAGSMFLGP